MAPIFRGAQRSLVILATGALASGCPSLSTLHSARPVPTGELEYSGSVGFYGFDGGDEGNVYLPLLEAQVRKGFNQRIDAGLKLSSFSTLQVDLTYALILKDDLARSVDPTVAVLPIAGSLVSYLWLPVLVDVITTDDVPVTLSVRWGVASIDGISSNDIGLEESTPFVGGGIGVRHRLSEKLTLMPEFHVLYSGASKLQLRRAVQLHARFPFLIPRARSVQLHTGLGLGTKSNDTLTPVG